MKKITLAISAFILLASFTIIQSGIWKNDKAHSQLMFTVEHIGLSDVSGTFNDFDVTVTSAKEDFSDAVFELTANVASIDTRVTARDNHLKSADFFDAEKYPTIHYKSSSLKKSGKNTYNITGDLTLHGVTKPVTMQLKYNGTNVDKEKNAKTAGFQLTGTINRSDFAVGPNFPAPMISNEVRIKADGEFLWDNKK